MNLSDSGGQTNDQTVHASIEKIQRWSSVIGSRKALTDAKTAILKNMLMYVNNSKFRYMYACMYVNNVHTMVENKINK